MKAKRVISDPLILWIAVTQAFIWNLILTVWGWKGPKSYKSWYQFTRLSFPFIPVIQLRSLFTGIRVFWLAYLYLLSFTWLELGELITSKHLVIDLGSGFRNPVFYYSSLVDVVNWCSLVCVCTLKILLTAEICYLCYVTRNWWYLLVRFQPIDQMTSEYTRNFQRVMSNWYDSLLEIPTFCFDKRWLKQKFLLLLMGRKKKKKRKRKLNPCFLSFFSP